MKVMVRRNRRNSFGQSHSDKYSNTHSVHAFLLSVPEAINSDNNDDASSIDSNDDEDDMQDAVSPDYNPRTNGVFWDVDHWAVVDDCCQVVIPHEPPQELLRWKQKRLTTDAMSDCVPSQQCCSCGTINHSRHLQQVGTLKVHTNIGSFDRRVMQSRCVCGSVMSWDPSTEFIHTIQHCKHGSELLLESSHTESKHSLNSMTDCSCDVYGC